MNPDPKAQKVDWSAVPVRIVGDTSRASVVLGNAVLEMIIREQAERKMDRGAKVTEVQRVAA
jgi:hypothetical protein